MTFWRKDTSIGLTIYLHFSRFEIDETCLYSWIEYLKVTQARFKIFVIYCAIYYIFVISYSIAIE